MRYLFHLGREPLLSESEIRSIVTKTNIRINAMNPSNDGLFLIVDAEQALPCEALMQQLGGTIAIHERLDGYRADITGITQYLAGVCREGKIEFSLSGAGTKNMGLAIKKQLKALERSVRYIEPKNTATILHNKLVEKQTNVLLFENAVFVTRAIQPIEAFSERDFGRPGFDAKSGMLPPKLARMMVNLSGAQKDSVLLDPFCGSGTVLTEAMDLGIQEVIGSDISEKAVADSQKNLEWFTEKFEIRNSKFEILLADAREVNKKIPSNSVDVLVTEPYLGKPLHGNESDRFLQKQIDELKEVYLGAFRAFVHVLKPGSSVVIAIPQFRYKDAWLMIDCVKEIEALGFIVDPLLPDRPSLLYWRKDQNVGRGIWRFKKSK